MSNQHPPNIPNDIDSAYHYLKAGGYVVGEKHQGLWLGGRFTTQAHASCMMDALTNPHQPIVHISIKGSHNEVFNIETVLRNLPPTVRSLHFKGDSSTKLSVDRVKLLIPKLEQLRGLDLELAEPKAAELLIQQLVNKSIKLDYLSLPIGGELEIAAMDSLLQSQMAPATVSITLNNSLTSEQKHHPFIKALSHYPGKLFITVKSPEDAESILSARKDKPLKLDLAAPYGATNIDFWMTAYRLKSENPDTFSVGTPYSKKDQLFHDLVKSKFEDADAFWVPYNEAKNWVLEQKKKAADFKLTQEKLKTELGVSPYLVGRIIEGMQVEEIISKAKTPPVQKNTGLLSTMREIFGKSTNEEPRIIYYEVTASPEQYPELTFAPK